MDRLEVHKAKRTSNERVGYVRDKITRRKILLLSAEKENFPYICYHHSFVE